MEACSSSMKRLSYSIRTTPSKSDANRRRRLEGDERGKLRRCHVCRSRVCLDWNLPKKYVASFENNFVILVFMSACVHILLLVIIIIITTTATTIIIFIIMIIIIVIIIIIKSAVTDIPTFPSNEPIILICPFEKIQQCKTEGHILTKPSAWKWDEKNEDKLLGLG